MRPSLNDEAKQAVAAWLVGQHHWMGEEEEGGGGLGLRTYAIFILK